MGPFAKGKNHLPKCFEFEMSFGISPSDIVKFFEGCVWLRDRFDKNNSAGEFMHVGQGVALLVKMILSNIITDCNR